MSYVEALACRACGARADKVALHACPACGGQLDPVYDWTALGATLDRDRLHERPRTIWRYRELLPLDDEPRVSREVGWTPLVEAPRLARLFGIRRLWLKVDGVSFPSLSFKDRVVAVALNRALELKLAVVGCPSTGNLANAVASHAAAAGLESWIFVPEGIEAGKLAGTAVYHAHVVRVRGTYDDANRLARAAADHFGWGIVNVNLRPYYGEGSKTMAFEIAEQLGWRLPTAVVAPMAGGSLVTKLARGFGELNRLGWTSGTVPRLLGVQAAGCAPIATGVIAGSDTVTPVEPATIARSIAIGDPVDGLWAMRAIRDTGGWAAAVAEPDVVGGIELLAATTGVFTETAGGVTVSAARQLAADGRLNQSDEVVLCLTGNGMKTVEVVAPATGCPIIDPELAQLERLVH